MSMETAMFLKSICPTPNWDIGIGQLLEEHVKILSLVGLYVLHSFRNTTYILLTVAVNDIGFSWNAKDSRWMLRYSQLMLFKRRFGHCLVPQSYEPNHLLGEWVLAQQKYLKTGKLLE
ncbi:LOW QUALITY PROTEIN: hypothetical protein ACHAWX_001771 [Stephanocyclus meneghinianus]